MGAARCYSSGVKQYQYPTSSRTYVTHSGLLVFVSVNFVTCLLQRTVVFHIRWSATVGVTMYVKGGDIVIIIYNYHIIHHALEHTFLDFVHLKNIPIWISSKAHLQFLLFLICYIFKFLVCRRTLSVESASTSHFTRPWRGLNTGIFKTAIKCMTTDSLPRFSESFILWPFILPSLRNLDSHFSMPQTRLGEFCFMQRAGLIN